MKIFSTISFEKKFKCFPKSIKPTVLKTKKINQVCEKTTFIKKHTGSILSIFQKSRPKKEVTSQQFDISEKVMIQAENKNTTERNDVTSSCTLEEDPVPPYSLLRYSMNNKDRLSFKCRRMTQPFRPVYEVEWQKNQWLQLEKSTNKQIEGLRKNGFSKVPIRKDTILMKHILYNNPSELDVLLELSLCNNDNSSGLSVRRTHWWQTSYKVGQANLPDWVDSETCCTLSAPSVFTIVNQTRSIKPLDYTEPPFFVGILGKT